MRAQVEYHGAISDLGRSAHLIVVVFERELRERFLDPVKRVSGVPGAERKGALWAIRNLHKGGYGLGDMLGMVKELTTKYPEARDPVPAAVRQAFEDCVEDLHAVLVLQDEVEIMSGCRPSVSVTQLRNQNGDYSSGLPSRIAVDAFRRTLLFGPDSPLARLVRVRAKSLDDFTL